MNESTQITYGAGTITIQMNSESTTEVASPDIRFGDYEQALLACFSTKELEAIDGGSNASVIMNFCMTDTLADNQIRSQFSNAVMDAEKTYGTLHEGVYIEVEASKSLDSYDYVELDTFNSDVEIQFDIPLYLVAEQRQYYMMENVMGVCEIANDVDKEADTLSISTHNLGTYLMLYQEKNEAPLVKQSSFQIKTQYLFLGAIVVLLIIWRIVDRRYKKQ